jgi:hypothetical protein
MASGHRSPDARRAGEPDGKSFWMGDGARCMQSLPQARSRRHDGRRLRMPQLRAISACDAIVGLDTMIAKIKTPRASTLDFDHAADALLIEWYNDPHGISALACRVPFFMGLQRFEPRQLSFAHMDRSSLVSDVMENCSRDCKSCKAIASYLLGPGEVELNVRTSECEVDHGNSNLLF